ncbi:MAG: hypothetical protein WBP81_12920, partial [Solirubrobacteraceae bacterium]
HVLDKGVPYNELGEEFFYRRDTENTERYKRRLVHQLERLGHQGSCHGHHRKPTAGAGDAPGQLGVQEAPTPVAARACGTR